MKTIKDSKACLLSIVIPCFNEGEIIEDVLNETTQKLNQKLDQTDYQIVIVDDGSHDGTWETVSTLANKNNQIVATKNLVNGGMWNAIHKGFRLVNGTYVTFLPADGEFSIDETMRLLENATDVDIVVSSRHTQDKKIQKKVRPWFREIISLCHRMMVKVFLNFDIKGTEGLFLFRWNSFKHICLRNRTDNIIYLEILSYALSSKMKIKRITTYYSIRRSGKSKALGLKNIIKTSVELISLAFKMKISKQHEN